MVLGWIAHGTSNETTHSKDRKRVSVAVCVRRACRLWHRLTPCVYPFCAGICFSLLLSRILGKAVGIADTHHDGAGRLTPRMDAPAEGD